jgi:hypothetical protein
MVHIEPAPIPTTIQEGCIMNANYALFSAALTIALTLPAMGQDALRPIAFADLKPPDKSGMMGKPTADATVEGLHIKVWVMLQARHKEIMSAQPAMMMKHGEKDTSMGMGNDMTGMKKGGMGMSKPMIDSMMTGTHHIGVDLADVANGKSFENASVRILIESPSKKNSAVDLKPMMSHFGNSLTLDEKGEYHFTVNVTVGTLSRTTKFEYTVN